MSIDVQNGGQVCALPKNFMEALNDDDLDSAENFSTQIFDKKVRDYAHALLSVAYASFNESNNAERQYKNISNRVLKSYTVEKIVNLLISWNEFDNAMAVADWLEVPSKEDLFQKEKELCRNGIVKDSPLLQEYSETKYLHDKGTEIKEKIKTAYWEDRNYREGLEEESKRKARGCWATVTRVTMNTWNYLSKLWS